MKKIIVDKEKCIGCGACIAIDPTHFDFSDEGYSEVINNENLDSEELKNAIDSCPTNAICNGDIKCDCENQESEETTCNCGNDCDCDEDCHCGCCNHE